MQYFHAENYLIMFKGYDLSPLGHPYSDNKCIICRSRGAVKHFYSIIYLFVFAFALSSSAFFAS